MKNLLCLLFAVSLYAQNFDAKRIQNLTYQLAMFQSQPDSITNMIILKREISRENYGSKPAIKIIETQMNKADHDQVIIYIDARDMKPLSYEKFSKHKKVISAQINDDQTISMTEFSDSGEKKSTIELPKGKFFSNSFSEIVQSIDFNKTKTATYHTFTPGYPGAQIDVERIDEYTEHSVSGRDYNCWILKFTIVQNDGKTRAGGYRYVDKKT
ncbi:MAG: hypothetical protein KDD94_14720, partial [Calditrichaeota bacterium]|nr:hypothetical protein [Calditrichota bacterium]